MQESSDGASHIAYGGWRHHGSQGVERGYEKLDTFRRKGKKEKKNIIHKIKNNYI
ncbi:hypothetical protein Fmac_007159 [Flemingia macrophylla]|uniref:Uncharacterized protein n=1 Tax=Flemingia macrophylla TaxID=520843 RepID=A0ABD1NCN7_9FABA